jgi:hypothetical protein
MARDAYKSEKRRKELERQKKLAEKREKRLHREERSEAEVLADLFGVPYQAPGEPAGGASPEAASGVAPGPGEAAAKPEDPSEPADPADSTEG